MTAGEDKNAWEKRKNAAYIWSFVDKKKVETTIDNAESTLDRVQKFIDELKKKLKSINEELFGQIYNVFWVIKTSN